MEISASCSCQRVRFRIRQRLETLVNCHCSDCRKMNGSAFSSMVVCAKASVEAAAGADLVATYALSSVVTKHFCRECGTPLFNSNERLPGLSMFFLGALDSPGEISPSFNVFCRSKLAWIDGMSALKSFAGGMEP